MFFDTNILIYYLNQNLPPQGLSLVDQAIEDEAYISVISRIELLGWPNHSAQSIQQTQILLHQNFHEYPITEIVVDRCITLRRQHNIKLPDAIIAATARHLQVPLVTRNTEDFQNITNLTLINPFDL